MDITSGLKLNVNRIKSPFGSSAAIPKISAGGGLSGLKPQAGIKPSSILTDPGTLVGQVKGDVDNINSTIAVEKRVSANERKITILKNILQNQKEAGNRELAETNEILKDIGSALALDFANRIQDNKDKLRLHKKSLLAQRRRDKEEGIEGKDKIDKDKSFLSKSFDKVTQPIQNIFGKIFEFFSLLGAGILAKGAFDWLQNPENLDKAKEMFKWLGDNWKWIAGAVALGAVAVAVAGLVTTISGIWGIFTAIGGLLAAIAPVAWPILAIAAVGLGAWFGWNWLKDKHAGGGDFVSFDKSLREKTEKAGLNVSADMKTATVLGDNGKPIKVNTFGENSITGETYHWYTHGRYGHAANDKQNLNINYDSHRQWILRNYGEDRLAELDAAYEVYKTSMDRKDVLKAEMRKAIKLARKNVVKAGSEKYNVRGLSKGERQALQIETLEKADKAEARVRFEYEQLLREEFPDLFGGQVNGTNGKDKISANLTKGEFVINKDSAQKIGSETLTALNSGNAFVSLQK